MATYNGFESFVGVLGAGDHHLDSGGDTLKFYATNAAPSAADDNVKTDLAEITAENGYPSGGSDAQNDYSEASGTGTLTCQDVTWTASGGTFGPLQYVVLYNDTHASDALIAWWEYAGGSTTVQNGEDFVVDCGASIFTIA